MLLSKIIFVRYHMFLTSLSQCCKDLEDNLASREYEMALEAVLSAAEHTNTMMWVGSMANCPYDLSAQGQLLKYGPVTTSLNGGLRKVLILSVMFLTRLLKLFKVDKKLLFLPIQKR